MIEEVYYTTEYRIGDNRWMSIGRHNSSVIAEVEGIDSIYKEYRVIRTTRVDDTIVRSEVKHEIRN